MSARISPIVSARRPLGADDHLQRLSVVNHRAEGLTELMGNRVRQDGHRLSATGVGRDREVSAAVQLGPLPGAALVEETDNQQRLDEQRTHRAEHGEPVFLPQVRSIEHDAAGRQPALGDPPPL